MSHTEILVNNFLTKAKSFQTNIEFIKVLKSRTYKIAEANVLIRAASEGYRNYFFGINYLTVEEMANLDNPYVAFICGSIDRVIIIPAKVLFSKLPEISHDRNGEYKININKELNIVLKGKNNRLDCKQFINNWDSLLQKTSEINEVKNSVEESLHSVLQGRLIEIGNIRGYDTYTPNKSKLFNNVPLEELASIKTCPDLQFSDYQLLRQIDVIWFKNKGSYFLPEKAFEVELTTGVWSGVGRMSTLIDYTNVDLYVVSYDKKKFTRVINTFSDFKDRYQFVEKDDLGLLYSAEKNLRDLRFSIGI
jgi:hypothetical protein